MARPPLSPVQRQLARVSRRLFLQTLLDHLARYWAAALAATAVWLLVHPLLLGRPEAWLPWTVAGGALALSTLVACFLAWWRTPSPLAAALALDAQFGLKERVTTSLSLSAQEAGSPAGLALLADVNQHVQPLDIPERFPVRLSWSAALVPVGAALLALIAIFYEPSLGTATTGGGKDNKDVIANATEIQKQLENLRKTPRPWPKDQPQSREMKEIEAAWDKLVNKPLDTTNTEQVRERVQNLRDLEEKMKDRLDGLKAQADKSRAVKQELGKLQKGAEAGKDGPAKELQDALAKGDTAKAKQEIERLMKKLREEQLKPEEQKQFEEQMEDLKNKLQRLADLQDRKDQLRRDREQGKIDQDQLEREMDRLAEEAQDLQELNDLAEDLADCAKSLRSKNGKAAAAKLARVLKRLEKLELDEQELKDLQEAQAELEEAREGLCECLDGKCEGKGLKNRLGKGRRPGTLRPIAPDAPVDTKDARQRADVDPKGKQRITGFTRGGTFSKVPAREVGGVFRQAVQEAPEAIERQRVPQDAAEMLKGYYENLGGQKKELMAACDLPGPRNYVLRGPLRLPSGEV